MNRRIKVKFISYGGDRKMEDQKPNVQTPLQNLTPPSSRKRPLDNNVKIEDSNYFKMRVLLKDLRPHFLEVLRTPEFENCKAAHEIRDKMKFFMDLYKEMTAEKPPLTKCQNVTGQIQDDRKPREHPNHVKSEEKPSVVIPSLFEDITRKGSYIVGGSAFGWNFITFTSSEAIYYGRTKEAFRAASPLPK